MGLKNETLKAIRAKEIIALKTEKGLTNAEVAREIGVHPETVKRALSWAEKAGLFVQYEDSLFTDVIPLAIKALKMALDDGDGELAVKVLNNTLWAANNNKGQQKESNGSSGPTEDLAAYIDSIRKKSQEELETIDGELTHGSHGANQLEERPVGFLTERTEAATETDVDSMAQGGDKSEFATPHQTSDEQAVSF